MKMQTSALALALVAGMATSASHAQVSNLGDLNTQAAVVGYVSLNGAAIPAGVYRRYEIAFDFTNAVGDCWSEESDGRLVNTNPLAAGSVTYSRTAIYSGGAFGLYAQIPFGAQENALPVPLRFRAQMPLAAPYNGGQPLFLLHRHRFAGTSSTWANTIVTLSTAASTIPTPNATVPALVFPALGDPSAVQTVTVDLPASATDNIRWVRITVPVGGLSAGNGRYLDIDTETSTFADPQICLFLPTGEVFFNGPLAAMNDEGGTDSQAQLTFGGSTNPRPAPGNGLVYNGRHGNLPAGDFYLAVTQGTVIDAFGDLQYTMFAPGFEAFSYGDLGGTVTVNISTGTATLPLPCVGPRETEPNDTRAQAFPVTLANTQSICGNTVAATAAGLDYYSILVPTAAGEIRQNVLTMTSDSIGQSLQVQGFAQAAGVINTAADVGLVGSVGLVNSRETMWFTAGNSVAPLARRATVLVAGSASTSADYRLTMTSTVVTPIESGITLEAGPVTITTAGATTVDTDMILLDTNLNPVPDALNDDISATNFQSTIDTTLAAGTYYVAISNYNLANDQASPASDGFRGGIVVDNPGVFVNTSGTTGSDLTMLIGSTGGTPTGVQAAKTRSLDVRFVKFIVNPGQNTFPARCNGADIAYDNGDFLPRAEIVDGTNGTPAIPGPFGGVNNGVTEADYNVFFANFFDANAVADIANDDGVSRVPTPAPGTVVNNGVTEGDYNYFFSVFFDGCSL